MKEKTKKYFGEALFIIGVFILVYGLLSFNGNRVCGTITLDSLGSSCDSPVKYFYNTSTKVLASVGGILVAIGIFMVRNRN